MTYELATISMHDLNSVTGAGGNFDALMLQRQQQHTRKPTSTSTPKGPSELGNVCRDAYSAVGGFVGGAATSETGAWGAIPGTLLGGMLGRALCPP